LETLLLKKFKKIIKSAWKRKKMTRRGIYFRSPAVKKTTPLSGKRFLFLALVAVVVMLFLRYFVIDIIQVTSASMEPTVNVGVRYLLEKITYRVSKPKRNDIVAFPSPVLRKHNLVKRIIAIEGDIIEIKNKNVYINSNKLVENFAYHSRDTVILVGDNLGPLQVPKNMLFVMGDNRDESEDSRDWKDSNTGEHIYYIPTSKIMGKIILLR
jgi:signal peptidase I